MPPLPGPLDAAVDRSTTFARKLRGVNGALLGRDNHASLLAYTIADMDLRAPQPVVDAVTDVAQSGIYGYTDPSEQLVDMLEFVATQHSGSSFNADNTEKALEIAAFCRQRPFAVSASGCGSSPASPRRLSTAGSPPA